MPDTFIQTWLSDPGSADNPAGGRLVLLSAPDINATNLPTNIIDKPEPQPKIYSQGTPEFLYWNLASALHRGSYFWSNQLPNIKWKENNPLQVTLSKSLGLKSKYTGNSLLFYRANIGGRLIHTCESPELVWHEMGHAVLDTIKPELWDFPDLEVDAFQESFGDISAILCNLQSDNMRSSLPLETNGKLYSSSSLSRFAEQLGWALRQTGSGQPEFDCLRNAVNSFFYGDPLSLPPNGPSSILSSESHSFSRIFTGAFFEGLVNMYNLMLFNNEDNALLQVSKDICEILVKSIQNTAVTQFFFSQVAASMINYASVTFPGIEYGQALRSAFIRHGIISIVNSSELFNMSSVHNSNADESDLIKIPVPINEYSLGIDKIIVTSMNINKQKSTIGKQLFNKDFNQTSNIIASKAYINNLIIRGHLKISNKEKINKKMAVLRPNVAAEDFSYTHELIRDGNDYVLKRMFI